MQKRNKHLLSILAILGFIAVALASAPSQKSLTNASKGQIPEELRDYKGTILIVKYSKDWTKYAEKYFTEYYNGNFEIISGRDLDTYKDLNKFRFVITRGSYTSRDYAAKTTTYSQDLCITDRQTGKDYRTRGTTSFYGKLLKAYAQAMEKVRSGNE